MLSPKNTVHLEGYLYLDPNKTKFWEGQEGGKKSMIIAKIKTPRAGMNKEKQRVYDYHKFKAFGSTADFIHKYCENNEPVSLSGELQIEDNFTKPDGTVIYGQPIVVVDSLEKCLRKFEDQNAQPMATPEPQQTQPAFGTQPTGGFGNFGNGSFNPSFDIKNLKQAAV